MSFRQRTGTRFRSVPYRGAGAAINDLVAGHIDIMIDLAPNSLAHVHAGTIKAYAVLAPTRMAAAPDLPTVDEAGLPGFHMSAWQALWAPKGTPTAVVGKLNAAVAEGLADPAVRCGSPKWARRPSRASSKRLRRLAHCRRPRSTSGGRSSRRRTSRPIEPALHRAKSFQRSLLTLPIPIRRARVYNARPVLPRRGPCNRHGVGTLRPPQTKAPGAPNILDVLFDDVGFSDFGCYGSSIKTATIDRLAAQGLRYTGFHTTAMCSTTRAALLTGRNHHSVGVGCLANFDSGFPGYRGKIAKEAGTLAEMLRPHAYRNYMVGKWHVTTLTEAGATGPFDGWPLGRGFDRFYGFMDAETDQYAPELVLDNSSIDAPGTFESGYHLTADLIDQSIRFMAGHAAERPDAPWLLWLALGACHAPHQAPFELIKSYDAVFKNGWDAERDRRIEHQKAVGIVPGSTRLPPRNDGVQAWESHNADERRFFTRLQSAYAAMLDHADRHLARLIGFLEQTGMLANTIVLVTSDNGASQEGGPLGYVNSAGPRNAQDRVLRGETRTLRRSRRPQNAFELPTRLGYGGQYAFAALQAEHARGRHSRSARRLLAGGDSRAWRASPPVCPRVRLDTDASGSARHRGPG